MNNLTFENLGKCYYVANSNPEDAGRLSEFMKDLRNRFRRSDGESVARSNVKEFWALRNVSLQVAPGTILGVIGANGAGKTTLLKLIARVTPPTVGRVIGVGRVVSLLELGAGFDDEVPALDNVLMNAALNGFSKTEAMARFDQIIDWAELREYMDRPLKFY